MLVGGRPAPLGPRHGAAPAGPSLVEGGGDRTRARAAASRASNSPINDPTSVASATYTEDTDQAAITHSHDLPAQTHRGRPRKRATPIPPRSRGHCPHYVHGMQQPQDQVPALLDGPAVDVSDAHELLLGYLEWYRNALMRKLADLSDDQLRTPVEPLGWSPLGLVQHLGWVERRWLRWGFGAEDLVAYPPGGDAAEWTVAADTSAAQVIAAYQAEVTIANARTQSAVLSDKACIGGRFKTPDQAPSLGRILFHLLQEYARHVGHLDVARELIDGVTGE
ncbi:putative damage-inducible protein DinB [Streptomyces sp. PsTaAH-137]|nr:putative damage-inducible protein DinB [Streptomyces sp. PsTaAH-137]